MHIILYLKVIADTTDQDEMVHNFTSGILHWQSKVWWAGAALPYHETPRWEVWQHDLCNLPVVKNGLDKNSLATKNFSNVSHTEKLHKENIMCTLARQKVGI